MADVTARDGEGGGRSPDHDRAQLLLVGALALAVLFVALALLLNTAIYTGNLATRETGADAVPAVEYVGETRTAGVDTIRSVNRLNNTSTDALNSAFNASIDRWDDLASHHRAVAGDGAAASVVAVENGTRIQQDNATRDYTDESGAANWTVAADTDLSGVRSLRLEVDESTLPSGFADDVFHVNVSSTEGTWSVYVYDTGSGPEVRVFDDGSEVAQCPAASVTDDTFVIDVPNESVGGAPCAALGDVDDLGTDAAIRYRYGDQAGGTYTMVVDEPPSALTLPGLADAGTGQPYDTPAIYSADLSVRYRTPELDYEARIEVQPP
ncbi:hypothetical protein [Halobellus ordinarius]|uniref:hypothetical protein n=1 Tax=Halobellus ordinarius TaxID=3075120 RepID=UPI0028808209|nr:hypothetical protein [Halobellus sp. ZY16]